MSMFPLARFDVIDEDDANGACDAWHHYLGPCDRPFASQYFGLFVADELISVAISASTVGITCGGYARQRVVELARLVTRPDSAWATRVCLRFWRELAPRCWSGKYWPVEAVVSYQSAVRHTGNIYRMDGWKAVAEVKGSTGGGTYATKKAREPKVVWVYPITSSRSTLSGVQR